MKIEEAIKEIEYAKSFGTSGVVPRWEAIETLLNYIDIMHKEFDRLEGIEDNTAMLKYELQQKDKVIDEMADKLHKLALYYDDEGTYCELRHEECDELNNVKDIHKHCTNCIKQYFVKKASE